MIDPVAFKTVLVKQAYELWSSKVVGGHLPGRRDIDPRSLGKLLPCVYLVDVTNTAARFTYRLVGTQINEWAGRELTGFALDAREPNPAWKAIFETYCNVARTGIPQYGIMQAPWPRREFYQYERIIAPLASDGRTVDMLFGALHILPRD